VSSLDGVVDAAIDVADQISTTPPYRGGGIGIYLIRISGSMADAHSEVVREATSIMDEIRRRIALAAANGSRIDGGLAGAVALYSYGDVPIARDEIECAPTGSGMTRTRRSVAVRSRTNARGEQYALADCLVGPDGMIIAHTGREEQFE
jgi:hypothetical protein